MNATIADLQQLVARCKAKHPELAGRLDRAASILASRPVERIGDALYRVESEARPGSFYRITLDGEIPCECPDAHRAPGGRCKHWLAVKLMQHLTKAPAPAERPRSAAECPARDTHRVRIPCPTCGWYLAESPAAFVARMAAAAPTVARPVALRGGRLA